jgi:hypothetical protein
MVFSSFMLGFLTSEVLYFYFAINKKCALITTSIFNHNMISAIKGGYLGA